ncbi:hypothetical protein UT300003_33140 [Clostridium sardiniense]
MDLMKFVPEQMITLMVGAYVLGVFLKRTPKIADWSIIWILLVFCELGSLGMNVLGNPLNGQLLVNSISQGIICTGVAVLTDQLMKQKPEKESEKEA